MASATGSSACQCSSLQGQGQGAASFVPSQTQPWLPPCCPLPTPNSVSCASDGHAGSCLSVLKLNNFWPEGVMVAQSKSGPLPLGRRMRVRVSAWEHTARHCSEMWHESVANECCLWVMSLRHDLSLSSLSFSSWAVLLRPPGTGYQCLGLLSCQKKRTIL